MLVEAGGKDLVMLVNNNGCSCLMIAASSDHFNVAEVQLGVCRQTDRNEALCRQIGHKE